MVSHFKKILPIIIIAFSFFLAGSVQAAVICDTNLLYNGAYCLKPISCETNIMYNGLFCNGMEGKSWNKGKVTAAGCNLETTCPANPSFGTYAINCGTNVCDLTCDGSHTKCAGNCNTVTVTPTSPCNSYDSCAGYCNGCIGTHQICASTHVCVAKLACLPGQTFNPCTNVCDGTASILKLGYDSVSGTSVIQSATYPKIFIPSTGYVGINTISPNDIFSIGNSGTAAPAGSSGTGHNYTSTYLSTDDYALANYGLVKSLIGTATSTMPTLWSGTAGGDIWNANSGNVGIGTTTPASKLQVYGTTGRLAIFGEVGASTAIANPVNVSFGSTYGNSTPGSVNNLKWDLFTSASSGSRYGIGMSSSLMEFQSGPGGGLGFFVNQGTEAMRILSTGNVGVGTTNPGSKFEIYNSANTVGTVYSSIISGDSGSSEGGALAFGNKLGAGGNRVWSKIYGYSAAETLGGGIRLATSNDDTGTMTDRLTILNNGYIGIGTTIPNDILSLANAGSSAPAGSSNTGHNYTSTYLSTDDYALTNSGYVKSLISAATSSITLWGGTTGGNVWNLNSGNVGIGTTTPANKLDVVGVVNATTGFRVNNTAGTAGNYLRSNGTNFVVSTIQVADVPTLNQNTTGAAYYITSRDTRAVNDLPQDLGSVIKVDFKQNSTNGLSDGGTYNGVMTWRKYGSSSDFSGGPALQLAYSDNGNMWTRLSTGTSTWATWVQILNSSTGVRLQTSTPGTAQTGHINISGTALFGGSVGIGAATPNDALSIGVGGVAAPAGSDKTGHNYASTYLSTDDYALANTGYVKSLISAATSSITTTAKYVGVTPNTYTGNNTGTNGNVPGYDKANDLCDAAFDGSHVCMAFEILYTIATKSPMPTESIAWIFNGPPGYTTEANDCDGRSKGTSGSYGSVWQIDTNKWVNGRGMLTTCQNPNKFACCK